MREILFRGKRRDNGEWIIGYYLVVDGISYILPEKYFLNGIVEVDPSTVGQCTGLVDKNGKKIFEGDICRYREVVDGETLLDESGSVLLYHGSWTLLNKFGYISVGQCSRDVLEVIGNIHDNPELLEGKKEGFDSNGKGLHDVQRGISHSK